MYGRAGKYHVSLSDRSKMTWMQPVGDWLTAKKKENHSQMRATMQFDRQSAPNSPQRCSKFPASNREVIQLPKFALLRFVSLFCSMLLVFHPESVSTTAVEVEYFREKLWFARFQSWSSQRDAGASSRDIPRTLSRWRHIRTFVTKFNQI